MAVDGFVGLAFGAIGLGVLHGVEPGHGWPVAATYALDRTNTWIAGLLASTILGIGHLVSSIAMVVVFFWAKAYFGLTQVGWMNYVAGVLLVLLGLREYRLYRRGEGHGHGGEPPGDPGDDGEAPRPDTFETSHHAAHDHARGHGHDGGTDHDHAPGDGHHHGHDEGHHGHDEGHDRDHGQAGDHVHANGGDQARAHAGDPAHTTGGDEGPGHAGDRSHGHAGHHGHSHDGSGGVVGTLLARLPVDPIPDQPAPDEASERGILGITAFAFALGFAHEEEFEIIALCIGSEYCLELMLVYALAVVVALVGLTLGLIAGYEHYEERVEAYAEYLPAFSAVVLVGMGLGFLVGVF